MSAAMLSPGCWSDSKMSGKHLISFLLCCPALLLAGAPVDFSRDIQPIFKARCETCHGAQQQMSGLRLDQKEDALRGGNSGPVIKPGHSADSKLIQLVTGANTKVVMPPAGPRLSAAEIGLLRAWIDEGANWPAGTSRAGREARMSTHWAFQKPKRPTLPAVRNRSWVRNAIDAFVLANLERQGITPSPEADRATLIRRVSLDLIGLPPTPKEIADFVNDQRPDAYERLVDRLLASAHYGERWARPWLDLARYADSDGYETDMTRPHAWRYRHWVIDALNRDMPFDEFTIQQIAGDLLPGGVEQKIATGFHRNTLTNREGGVDREEFRDVQVVDRTSTLGTVWLGLTVGCAQCHDHKYDPISQKEFYQLFAFFNTAEEVDIDAPLPGELGPYLRAKPEYDKNRRELLEEFDVPYLQAQWEKLMLQTAANPGKGTKLDNALKILNADLEGGEKLLRIPPEKRTQKQADTIADYFVERYRDVIGKNRYKQLKFNVLHEQLKALAEKFPAPSQAQTIAESSEPPRTYIHVRGDFRQKGIEVQPATPAVLHPLPAGAKPNRLVLAHWLVSPENPLTARVTVNRIWQELFGRGLVRTSEDFGSQGEPPSHPDLLDWLATEFAGRRWSMKQMQRLIVTSATYRQSSKARPDLEAKDPDNVLLARQARLRLPAELIRDSALAVSGLLEESVGGKSIRPPQPAGIAELTYAEGQKWPESQGRERYRRGLYIHFQRTAPYPQLMNFDEPDSNVTCSRRSRSNTPRQALNLFNDPVFFEAAQALAFRILHDVPGGFRERLHSAFELCVARPPSPTESVRIKRQYEAEIATLKEDAKAVTALFPDQLDGVPQVEAAAWVEISRVLLNLDEFVNRE